MCQCPTARLPWQILRWHLKKSDYLRQHYIRYVSYALIPIGTPSLNHVQSMVQYFLLVYKFDLENCSYTTPHGMLNRTTYLHSFVHRCIYPDAFEVLAYIAMVTQCHTFCGRPASSLFAAYGPLRHQMFL